jgi:hypothetical protein
MRSFVGLMLGALSVSGCSGVGDKVGDIPTMASDYILVLPQSGELYEFPVRTLDPSAILSVKQNVYIDLDRSTNPPDKVDLLVRALRQSSTSIKTYDTGDEECRTESLQDDPPCLAPAMHTEFRSTYWNTIGSFEPRNARSEIRSLRGTVSATSHMAEAYEIWVVHNGVIRATAHAIVGDNTRFVSLSVRTLPADEKALEEVLLGLASLYSDASPNTALLIRLSATETAEVFQKVVIFTH